MTPIPETYRQSRAARWTMYALVAVHAVLLLLMVPDYFADNDLGYHVSLGRQYGEHGTYFWDNLNWAPSGRPNLQGPLLHYAIGIVGRLLSGGGDQYVTAFALLAVLQWAAAMFTAIFFARRFGGDWAGLIAAALMSGSVWSAGSFFVGVPSGWIFILTPWAIHFFLQDRYVLAALFTTAVMYVHLGGAAVAPFGILLAAVFTRRWKGLLMTGGITAVLTSVYIVHFVRHLGWYNGQRGFVAGSFATLTYLLAVPGLVWLMRRPKENLFLLIWAVAPLAWLFQDGLRFMLQSTVAASAIGGIFVTWLLGRIGSRPVRGAIAGALVLLATVFPLSIPSLPVEFLWAAEGGFPRELDWREARELAEVMDRAGLSDRIVNPYYDSLSAAMAVYSPLRQEFGHWGEVRPPVNPAQNVSAGEKLYLLPLPPDDSVLADMQALGWITVHGGSERTALATLPDPAPLEDATPHLAEIIHRECLWLAENAVNNEMPPPEELFDSGAIDDFRRTTTVQRNHAGRVEAAVLVYAYAAEAVDPELAAGTRGSARGWGSIANFIGDETAMDYLSDEQFERFLGNARRYGQLALELGGNPIPSAEMREHSDKLFDEFFARPDARRAGK